MLILTILYTLLGWLVGIAINHAADVLPTRTTLRQWPGCSACGARRPFLAWSALLSYLTGQQKCAACGQPHKSLLRSAIVEL
ncbi:MAG TPA: hypothetical protein VEC93_07660, partial [Anaerolineae bacterium]|nr:hypothetical protein [Anaerolineae bacterium]